MTRLQKSLSLPSVPAKSASAVIGNGMIQVSSLKVLHHHDGAVRLQACPYELNNVPVMAALQDGNFLLEDVQSGSAGFAG